VSRSPDELVDDTGDIGARDRTYSQLPPAAVGVLCQASSDTGFLKQAAHDRGATVAVASRPAHVNAEATGI
jgi:hypothetical protein